MGTRSVDLYDALLNGQLKPWLKKWRSDGVPVREIADRVTDRLPDGQSVTHASITRWCKELGYPAINSKGGKAA